MHPIARRVQGLIGFQVRVHISTGRRMTSTLDGVCQGVEQGRLVLAPSSQGERSEIPLKRIATVTTLAGGCAGKRRGLRGG
ncbi:MAG: hypothetical protein JXA37_07550 [Chloroflexia bacterium]|nr:hypothetical protein [Chloroflexia bacterium]